MINLASAFLIGIVSSSHCLGMCGGLSIAAGLNSSNAKLVIWYNLGRISTYTIIGFIFGFFSDFLPSSSLPYLQLISCVLLILSAFYVLGATSILTQLERIGRPLWKVIQPYSAKLIPVKSPTSAFFLGMLWGMIPCGLVYTALAFSVSVNSSILAAVLMFCFGLGTLPAMIGTALLANKVRPLLSSPRFRISMASAIILMAVLIAIEAISSLR